MSGSSRLVAGGPGWPAQLAHLGEAEPLELWVRGRSLVDVCASPALAVVGARRCSAAADRFARRLAEGLAEAGVAVVSGLALGVDAAAHAGALAAGGRTAAVLGCGIDRLYPRRNAQLGRAIAEHGVVVSEWGPGVEPAPWRFPVRNRLIAGLADATLVVEATRRSGALITADHALALGRDVLAVPGAPWHALAEGTNALLRAGAVPITGVDDALDALGLPPRPASTAPVGPPPGLPAELWEALRSEPARPDALALRVRRPAAEVAAALAELELLGLLVTEADGTLVAVQGTRRPTLGAC